MLNIRDVKENSVWFGYYFVKYYNFVFWLILSPNLISYQRQKCTGLVGSKYNAYGLFSGVFRFQLRLGNGLAWRRFLWLLWVHVCEWPQIGHCRLLPKPWKFAEKIINLYNSANNLYNW
jgi:hypothetical protein